MGGLGSFTAADTPRLRQLVQEDLGRLTRHLETQFPGGAVLLGGSFALGEAVATVTDTGQLHCLSDYDVFVLSPARAAGPALVLRRWRSSPTAMGLHNPRVDLNLILAGLVSLGWQHLFDLVPLAGYDRPYRRFREATKRDPVRSAAAREEFIHYTLQQSLDALLSTAPIDGTPAHSSPAARRERAYQINRCALHLARLSCNLASPTQPVYRVSDCLARLVDRPSPGLSEEDLTLLQDALEQNVGVDLLRQPAPPQPEVDQRWRGVRRLLLANAGWHRQPARRLVVKLWLPHLRRRMHRRSFPQPPHRTVQRWTEARLQLLRAIAGPGQVATEPLRRAQRLLARLGLVDPQRKPDSPVTAACRCRRAARLPVLGNPLRMVATPEGP